MEVEAKLVDVGGVFNFIRHRPRDTEHTKYKKLWMQRFDNGMCPHCGQILFKVHRVFLWKKFLPMNIPGKVDNGSCVHPSCDPPSKTKPKCPTHKEDLNPDDNVTVSSETDGVLDAINEQRANMAKFYRDSRSKNIKKREAAAVMLEDTIMQLNRSMAEMDPRQRNELLQSEGDLKSEVDTAKEALRNLGVRFDPIMESVTDSLKGQFEKLRRDRDRDCKKASSQVDELRASLGRARAGGSSDREKAVLLEQVSNLSDCLDDWQRENKSLRAENNALRHQLQSLHAEKDQLQAWLYYAQQQSDSQPRTQAKPNQMNHGIEVPYSPQSPPSRDPNRLADFPELLKFKCKQTLTEHSGDVSACVAINHGQQLAYANKNTIIIYQLRQSDGKYLFKQQLQRHSDRINRITVAQDTTRTLVTASDDKTLVVWKQAHNGVYVHNETLGEHSGSVQDCAITDDGLTLVSGCGNGSVIVWQRLSGGEEFQLLQTLETGTESHRNGVECCAIRGDAQSIVAAKSDGTFKVWERHRDKEYNFYKLKQTQKFSKSIFGRDTNGILCCAFDKSGKTMVSGDKGNKLFVWTLQTDGTYKQDQILKDHGDVVSSCVLCHDGNMLVSASDDDTMRIWTREPHGKFQCKQKLEKKHKSFIQCCAALRDDGQMLVSGAVDAKIWELQRK